MKGCFIDFIANSQIVGPSFRYIFVDPNNIDLNSSFMKDFFKKTIWNTEYVNFINLMKNDFSKENFIKYLMQSNMVGPLFNSTLEQYMSIDEQYMSYNEEDFSDIESSYNDDSHN